MGSGASAAWSSRVSLRPAVPAARARSVLRVAETVWRDEAMTDEREDVLMPAEEGRNIPSEVVAGLAGRTVSTRLWVSTSVGDRRLADARNHVKQYGASTSVLMLENDVAMPPESLTALSAHKSL